MSKLQEKSPSHSHKNHYTFIKFMTSLVDSSIYFLCILKGTKHKIIPSPPLQFHSLRFQHFLQCFPSIVGLLGMTLRQPSSPIMQTRVVDSTPTTNSRTMKKTNQVAIQKRTTTILSCNLCLRNQQLTPIVDAQLFYCLPIKQYFSSG